MELYDTVPQEADAKQDALEEPGVAVRVDGEEDAPQEPPPDRVVHIISSEGERSGIDERISPPTPRRFFDCQDAGCTWPCAHHLHKYEQLNFYWYPGLERFDHEYPGIPKVQSGMKVGVKDCQFCRIFFSIEQSDCGCGANAQHDDHIPKSVCGFQHAHCKFRSNGQLSLLNQNLATPSHLLVEENLHPPGNPPHSFSPPSQSHLPYAPHASAELTRLSAHPRRAVKFDCTAMSWP